jgi:V/A-type H+-transporting ATPase subunit A
MGEIVRIAGPVGAANLEDARLYDVVEFGDRRLIGEVIRLDAGLATVQVYEDTSGVRVGEPVRNTGMPLVAWLGPGLLGQTYDGLQRPLKDIAEQGGYFIERGVQAPPLPLDRLWAFTPCVDVGSKVMAGDVLGTVPETPVIQHRIMVPPGIGGEVSPFIGANSLFRRSSRDPGRNGQTP